MQYKTNRTNHDFQIVHFLVGSCHTADGAYALLCDLHEDRDNAIKSFEAAKLREQARIVRAKRKIASEDEAEQLEGKADLVEIEALRETTEKNLAAAVAERATIELCMQRLEPLRQWSHLSPAQAHQAAQREEWRLELIRRAENHLLTSGQIPPEQFDVMRTHPDFKTSILPALKHIEQCLISKTPEKLLETNQSPIANELKDLLMLESPK